jgi:predicted metal-dependent enzyme (double-stranded beta helix superfamily)
MAGAFEIERFVEDLKTANAQGQRGVNEILARAMSEPGSVLAAVGEPETSGFHVLYRADDLTVINVVWAPLMVLLPHNHTMWASIGIYTGREDNILWHRDGATIEAKGAASLSERQVFSLGTEAIHSVINPIPRLTGAIHVYGGDFFRPGRSEWDPGTLAERPFDLDALRERFSGS